MKPTPPPPARKTDRRDARHRRMALERTNRESEYIDWLSKNRIPIVVKLVDGEEARGWIEYYDRDIIRLTRTTGSNLFIFKERVKYLYEEPQPRSRYHSPMTNL